MFDMRTVEMHVLYRNFQSNHVSVYCVYVCFVYCAKDFFYSSSIFLAAIIVCLRLCVRIENIKK